MNTCSRHFGYSDGNQGSFTSRCPTSLSTTIRGAFSAPIFSDMLAHFGRYLWVASMIHRERTKRAFDAHKPLLRLGPFFELFKTGTTPEFIKNQFYCCCRLLTRKNRLLPLGDGLGGMIKDPSAPTNHSAPSIA
ncbi:hypothetical protein PUN28_008493 [Cardiocondyla obscurior]|uniref:LAGLIDADG homing endonuclease n=1 Tax=Cardiocondyla obscurior TaxID=286306 RepID=A0AAW2FZZ4_9HYME